MDNPSRSALSFLKHFPFSPQPGEAITVLHGFGTPGESVSLSFSISSSQALNTLEFTASALQHSTGIIPSESIELYLVKIWEQAGLGVYQSEKARVAELLLKDDSVPLRDGYAPGYKHWKDFLRRRYFYRPPDIRLRGKACTSLAANQTKQVWIEIKIPPHSAPGFYSGRIEARSRQSTFALAELPLTLEVLPLKLPAPSQDFFLWYKGTLDSSRPQFYVSEHIFRAQLEDIFEHGWTSLSLNEHRPHLARKALAIAAAVGFRRHVVFSPPYPTELSAADCHGLTPVFYLSDEADARGAAFVKSHIENWRTVRQRGGITMASLIQQSSAKRLFGNSEGEYAPDILSCYLPKNLHYFRFHSRFEELRKSQIYYYWFSHMEKPDLHRALAGVLLWKSRATGIAPYCYQHPPRHPFSPFNDFDEWEPDHHLGLERRPFKDLMTTYPAKAGSIATLQWKGLREGITDLKYLTTLEAALRQARTKNGEIKTSETKTSESLSKLIVEIEHRRAAFLERISLTAIEITSETEREPYAHIQPEEYHDFREQVARDTIALQELMNE